MHQLQEYMRLYKSTLLIVKTVVSEWSYNKSKKKQHAARQSKEDRLNIFKDHRVIVDKRKGKNDEATEKMMDDDDENKILFGKNQDLCKSHHLVSKKVHLSSLKPDNAGQYRHCITYLTVQNQQLQDNFLSMLQALPCIEGISFTNCNITSLNGVGQC